jgi:hypothetical protein
MGSDDFFEIEVPCESCGPPHRHVVRLSSGPGIPGFATGRDAPGTRKVRFVCPVSGDAQYAEFESPAGFRWPFTVEAVQ